MAPRPVLIFQKISPSDSAWTFLDVQSAGLGLSAADAAPSPLPLAPWQATQFTSATFLPCATVFASEGSGFFFPFSAAGASHAPWACTGAEGPRATTTPAASATTVAACLTALRISCPPKSPVVGKTSGCWQDLGGPPPRRRISEKIHKSTTSISSRPYDGQAK